MAGDIDAGGGEEVNEDEDEGDEPVPQDAPASLDEEEEEERIEIVHYLAAGVAGAAAFWALGLPFFLGAIGGPLAYLLVWYYVLP